MRFRRTDAKYAVDTLMFLSLVGIVVIGFLMAFIIPEGPAPFDSRPPLNVKYPSPPSMKEKSS
jgi:hypothetical protein